MTPLIETEPDDSGNLPNLIRESWPPYLDELGTIPLMTRRRPRR